MKQRNIIQPIAALNIIDIEDAIQKSARWKKISLQHFYIHDVLEFTNTLQNTDTKFYLVSDGGLHEGKGSFGVSMGNCHNDLVNIEGPAPGNSILMTSLRSEAYGFLAGITFLNMFIQTYHVTIPTNRIIHCYSDNLGLVKWIEEILTNNCYPRMTLRAEADVLLQIEHEIKSARQLNIKISIEHVKGHQDDFVTFNELSRQAQLNVRADSYATNYIQNGKLEQYD